MPDECQHDTRRPNRYPEIIVRVALLIRLRRLL